VVAERKEDRKAEIAGRRGRVTAKAAAEQEQRELNNFINHGIVPDRAFRLEDGTILYNGRYYRRR